MNFTLFRTSSLVKMMAFIFLYSCKKEGKLQYLTGGDCKYWYQVMDATVSREIGTDTFHYAEEVDQWKFCADGTIKWFTYHDGKLEKPKAPHDIEYPDVIPYSIVNDSTMTWYGGRDTSRIVFLSVDSFVFKNLATQSVLIFKRSKILN